MTSVVVTHEMDSAFRIADRMAMLDSGRMLKVGRAEEFEAIRDGPATGDETTDLIRQFLRGDSEGPITAGGCPPGTRRTSSTPRGEGRRERDDGQAKPYRADHGPVRPGGAWRRRGRAAVAGRHRAGRRGPRAVFVAGINEGNLGLEIGSAVKINDAVVGRLNKIEFRPDQGKTYYVASLARDDVKVYADARAAAIAEFIGGASIVLEDLGAESAGVAGRDNPAALTASNSLLKGMGFGADQKAQFQQALGDVADSARSLSKVLGVLGATPGRPTSPPSSPTSGPRRISCADLRQAGRDRRGRQGQAEQGRAGVAAGRGQADGRQGGDLLGKRRRHQPEHQAADRRRPDGLRHGQGPSKRRPRGERHQGRGRDDGDHPPGRGRDHRAGPRGHAEGPGRAAGEVPHDQHEPRGGERGPPRVSATTCDIIVLNRDRLDDTLANVKGMSANLEAAAMEIRRNPWRLLHRPNEKELQRNSVYDAARAFVEGAGRWMTRRRD